MTDMPITHQLVGQKVRNPSRPEWGIGTVLRVQSSGEGEGAVHRVSVQFHVGHKTIVIPPGRLALPEEERPRGGGWLDTLARLTPDDRLRSLPHTLTTLLGTGEQRLRAVGELYDAPDDPGALVQWARRQTDVADPLSHWSRDELMEAYRAFCQRRDEYLLQAAAMIRKNSGIEGIRAALSKVEGRAARQHMRVVLGLK